MKSYEIEYFLKGDSVIIEELSIIPLSTTAIFDKVAKKLKEPFIIINEVSYDSDGKTRMKPVIYNTSLIEHVQIREFDKEKDEYIQQG